MQRHNVILYTTSWCPHCDKTRKFLEEKGISYMEYDVEENDEKWREGLGKSGGKDIVPIIDIDGTFFFGRFEEIKPKIEKALE